MLLHPLLKRHVPSVRALSHLDQVIGEHNQHPIPIATPRQNNHQFRRARVKFPDAQIVHPHAHQFPLLRAPFFAGFDLQFVPSIRTIRSKVGGADLVHGRVNSLSEVLHVLHQINAPVGQFFRDLPMGEHPHKLEDEFIFTCRPGDRLVPSLSERQIREHLPCMYASSSDGPSRES